MKESITTTASTAVAAVESRLGQKLIKTISNVCFSFFVVSVLVFTVIAITYQPPDPWMDTSKALTTSFTDVLLNSTFNAPDDGSIVLPTGEDVNISAPANMVDQNRFNFTALGENMASSCNRSAPDSPLDCADPGVLLAIQRFNAKIFKGIVFLSYETPVSGEKPGECHSAWSFRNRKEKSWRRYRDFRRFNLVSAENCTFEVVKAGKFRSGKKASKRVRVPGVPDPTGRPVIVIDSIDRDINDTIPTVGKEEFRKGRYLYYSRGGDHCKGMNHYLWSFLCGLGEAQLLNRTFVMDMNVCLSSTYNPSSNTDEDGKDFRFYFDYEHLKETASVVEEKEFLKDWSQWEIVDRGKKKKHVTVRKVPTYKITPKQLKKDRRTILWRQFDGPEPENYWYRVCEGKAAKYVHRPWHSIWKSKRLMNIVTEIAGKMDWDYDAVHVVRGMKAANKDLWPNLDRDTSPRALVNKLLKLVKEWRNLYIATNEPFYNYFDKFRSHYKVHLLDDYRELWGDNSEWHNETTSLNGGNPVEFDGFMRMAVDTEVLYRAKTQVETFNNLTMDCKDGVNSCFQ